MSNREKNINYDNEQVIKPITHFYDFTAVDFALRVMATYSGFEKDQNNYQKMKEMYE